MKTNLISIKRVGLTSNYEIASMKNQTNFKLGEKTFRVSDRMSEKEVDLLCADGKMNVTVRAG